MKIYKQTEYVSDAGNAIYRHDEIKSTFHPEDAEQLVDIKYFAMADHAVMIDGQPRPDRFRIDIPATCIAEAFELLPKLMPIAQEKRMEEIKAMIEARRRQVILPNGQTLPPAGRPNTRLA